MELPTMDGYPVLGYLFATRLSCDFAVDIDKYNAVVDEVVLQYGAELECLRAKQERRPKDILANALKAFVQHYEDGAQGYSYLIRKKGGAYHLVREHVEESVNIHPDADPSYKGFVYGDIGSVSTKSNEVECRPAFAEAARADVTAVFTEIRGLYEANRRTFPSSAVRHKLLRLVTSTVPLGFDPEHKFWFILAEHRNKLLGIKQIINALNEMAPGTGGLSILPLPDMATIREHVVERCVEEVEDAIRTVTERMSAHDGELPARKTEFAIGAIKQASDLAMLYRTKFGAGLEKCECALDALRVQLGELMQPRRPKRVYGLDGTSEIETVAQHLGNALCREDIVQAIADVAPDRVVNPYLRQEGIGRVGAEVFTLVFQVSDLEGKSSKEVDLLTIKLTGKSDSYTILFNGAVIPPQELPLETTPVGKMLRLVVDQQQYGFYDHPVVGIVGAHIGRWFRKWWKDQG